MEGPRQKRVPGHRTPGPARAPRPAPGRRRHCPGCGGGRGPAEGPCTRSRPRDPPPSPSNRRRSRSCSATSCRKPKVVKCWLPWRQETRQSREPAAPLPRRQRARRVSVLELGWVRWRPQARALPCAGGAGRGARRPPASSLCPPVVHEMCGAANLGVARTRVPARRLGGRTRRLGR